MALKTPLGYIELENGPKEIYAMNDMFLNFTFDKEENWEEFRLLANILLDAYRQKNPGTAVRLIEGKIHIETQYKFYLNTRNTTRNQDFKLTEAEEMNLTYVEFQNKAKTKPPIETRAVDYFVLGIGQSQGKIANQLWLLAEDVETVLQGEIFTNYILKDEATNKVYPATSGMMFISLTKLSEEKSPAGELALFLLGRIAKPENEEIKRIAKTFNTSFKTFKDDKEVKNAMTMAEKWRNEGWIDGMEEGAKSALDKALELIKKGIDPEEAFQRIRDEY